MLRTRRFIILILLVLPCSAVLAQRTLEEHINVIRPYRPVLAEANKIRKNPDISDVQLGRPQLNYLVPDTRFTDNSNPGATAAKKPQSVTNIRPLFYAKAGVGNLGNLLGEAYLNNNQDSDHRYGGYFKHHSANGDMKIQQLSRTELGGFGNFGIGSNAEAKISASFGQRGNYLNNVQAQGTEPPTDPFPTLDTTTIRQTFDLFQAEAEIANQRTRETNIVYGLKVGGYTLSDKYDGQESNFYLNGLFGKQFGAFSINLAGGIDLTKLEGPDGYSFDNPVYRFQPYLLLKSGSATIKAGINLVGIGDDNGFENTDRNVFLFPDASIDFELIENYLSLFGGVNGDVSKNTMKQFSQKNTFMRNFSGLSNSREKYNLFGGLRGSFSSSVGFKAQFEYSQVDFQNFMVNDPDGYLYDFTVYDGGQNGKRMQFNGELNIRYSEAFRMNAGLNTFSFESDDLQRAWNVPVLEVYVSPVYNYRKKLSVTADLFYTGERYAFISEQEGNPSYRTLDAFTDFNLGASYQINRNYGVFLNANNILNKQYQRYLNYPVMGFNMIGGATFTF